jgi:hypothetical protein
MRKKDEQAIVLPAALLQLSRAPGPHTGMEAESVSEYPEEAEWLSLQQQVFKK